MPTPEEIENDRKVLTDVITAKKENIEYWKSEGCGLDKPTASLSISIAEGDLVKLQARLDALPSEAEAREPAEAVTEPVEATEDEAHETLEGSEE